MYQEVDKFLLFSSLLSAAQKILKRSIFYWWRSLMKTWSPVLRKRH